MRLQLNTNDFVESIRQSLKNLEKEIEEALPIASEKILKVTLDEVLNRENWNEKARYKVGPRRGQKYDAELSGQMLEAIRNHTSINISGKGFQVGIGNIPILDSLKSKSTSGSDLGLTEHFPYWRSIVYGRRPIEGIRFAWDGVSYYPFGDMKPKGKIVPGGRMRGIEGTFMFHNGLNAARGVIQDIMLDELRSAVRRASRR